jgi:hypothetical protein
MNKPNDLSESVIFPKGQKITDERHGLKRWFPWTAPSIAK